MKRCWLHQVTPGGLAALAAPAPSVLFAPSPPPVWLDLPAGQVASLRAHLHTQLDDPRRARGIRHGHAATAVIAAAALLAGKRLPAAMAGYAALSQDALAVFGARTSPRGGYVAPPESSLRRFLHGLPPGALPGAVTTWLTAQAAAGMLTARSARQLSAALSAAAGRR